VVVQEAFADTETLRHADVALPATTWGEKDGTVTNSERRISRVRAVLPAPGEARADWSILADAARRLAGALHPGRERGFAFENAEAVWLEHRGLTVGRDLDIGGLSWERLERDGPQQWPLPAGAPAGQPRLYADARFATANGKARFSAAPWRAVAEPVDVRYPIALTTGRLRDQWHSMSRTGRVPALFAQAEAPTLVYGWQRPDAAWPARWRTGDGELAARPVRRSGACQRRGPLGAGLPADALG
jgi:assimilatory nitrate reductase catalytic subunit